MPWTLWVLKDLSKLVAKRMTVKVEQKMAIGRFHLVLSSSLMQCPALRTDRCELVVDIGLGLRRMWKAEGQVGFSRFRGRCEQITGGGKGSTRTGWLGRSRGIKGALEFTGGKYRQMLQKEGDPRHWWQETSDTTCFWPTGIWAPSLELY